MKKVIIFLVFHLAQTPQALAGNSTGGGDNFRFADEAAWFTGSQKTILGCVEISPTFGVPLSSAQADVYRAFAIWRNYIDEKRVFIHYPDPVGFATSFKFIDVCDGSEDIRFYFGVSNNQVESAKLKYHNPTAFVERTSFDEKLNWGKGFVWVAAANSLDLGFGIGRFPKWDQENNFLAILLHEIGHVYGNDHVSGTIMTSEISDILSASDHWRTMKTKIDHSRELYRCNHCEYDISSTISIDDKSSDWKMMKVLIGRAPDDFAKIRMIRLKNAPVITVEVSDGAGIESFRFMISSEILVNNDVKIFRSPLGLFHNNYSSVSYATTLEQNGKPMALTLEYNMVEATGGSPLILTALDDGRRVELARFLGITPDSLP